MHVHLATPEVLALLKKKREFFFSDISFEIGKPCQHFDLRPDED